MTSTPDAVAPAGAGILAVASAIPRGRVSAEELGRRFGVDPHVLTSQLGIIEKPVALADDEHPSHLAARAARSALAALEARPDDVGLVVFAGVSRDYPPSWCVAVDIIEQLGLRHAVGYDLGLGCAATVIALDLASAARQRNDGRPPLAIVACAERWSHTITPEGGLPLTMLAHADGGAACILGPNAPAVVCGPPAQRIEPDLNGYVLTPAGGTREPLSAATLLAGRQHRTIGRPVEQGDLVDRYVRGYETVVREACQRLPPGARRIDLLLMNQTRRAIRGPIQQALALDDSQVVETYPRLGHLGGADILVGLETSIRAGMPARNIVLAASSPGAFAAVALVAAGDRRIAVG